MYFVVVCPLVVYFVVLCAHVLRILVFCILPLARLSKKRRRSERRKMRRSQVVEARSVSTRGRLPYTES